MTQDPVPSRPLLLGLYHVVPLGPDRVQVCNAGRTVVLACAGAGDRLVPLLEALDGSHDLEELNRGFPGMAARILPELARKGLLGGAGKEMGDGDAATAAGLSRPGGAPAVGVAARLRDATVAVVGCDPVGGAVAALLARAGVGHIVLSDLGDPAVSALDVQLSPALAALAVGGRRAAAIQAACSAVSNDACFQVTIASDPWTPEPAIDVVVISAHHTAEGRLPLAADVALARGVPYLLHWQDALEAVVAAFARPGGPPCHRCVETRRLSHIVHLEEHRAYLRHRELVAPAPDAHLAAHTSVVAGLVATEALGLLVSPTTGVASGALIADLGTLEVRREPVLPVPGCAGCSAPEPVAGAPSS